MADVPDLETRVTVTGPVVVDVRNRFDGSWSRGFEVVESVATPSGSPRFKLRRRSDGYVLPDLFDADQIAARPV